MIRMVSCAISMAIALVSARADGTEIKVISAGAVRGLIAEMIADYARETGDRFDFKIGTTGQLRTIIASGQPADLIIASATLMAELEASRKMISGTGVELGRVGIGIAVRDGAPVADVASLQGFKQALIEARSVAYSDPRQGEHPACISSACSIVWVSPMQLRRRPCSPMAAVLRWKRWRGARPTWPSP